MKQKKIILENRLNGIVLKAENKRIAIARTSDDHNVLQFKKLMEKSDKGKNTSFAVIVKDKIAITEIGLSNDGLILLKRIIDEYLNRNK